MRAPVGKIPMPMFSSAWDSPVVRLLPVVMSMLPRISPVVHGDDFVALGSEDDLAWYEQQINHRVEVSGCHIRSRLTIIRNSSDKTLIPRFYSCLEILDKDHFPLMTIF